MFKSIFFTKQPPQQYWFPMCFTPPATLVKLALFTPHLHYLRSLKIFKIMYQHHILLNCKTLTHLYYVTYPFKFFHWATFKSFKPALRTVYQQKSNRTGRKRPKFIVKTAVAPKISPGFVKGWMNQYLLLLPPLYLWQKILFIYISLLQARRQTPIFFWYTSPAERIIPARYKRKKQHIRHRRHRKYY